MSHHSAVWTLFLLQNRVAIQDSFCSEFFFLSRSTPLIIFSVSQFSIVIPLVFCYLRTMSFAFTSIWFVLHTKNWPKNSNVTLLSWQCLSRYRIRSSCAIHVFTRFPRMLGEVHGLWKCHTTFLAAEGFLPHMCSNVVVQRCCANKCAWAEPTLEWPLSSMGNHMRTQVWGVSKCFTALSTLERLGRLTRTHVHL